jgi:hypothetical protein
MKRSAIVIMSSIGAMLALVIAFVVFVGSAI